MILYKTSTEVEQMRHSALLVGRTLAEVGRAIRPGLPTHDLDSLAETYIRDHGAEPAFKGYKGFPWTLCTSPNEEVVHGMPSGREIAEGDVLSIDCGVILDGWVGDSAYTFLVGEGTEEVRDLLAVTKAALEAAIALAVAGNRIGDLGHAVQHLCEKEHGYGVVRELVGHGIGRDLHEEPQVPNFGKRGRGMMLKEGLVVAIEPMVNLGRRKVVQRADGWTVAAADGNPSAHFEHTVAVRREGPDLLTSFDPIEEAERNNPELGFIELTEKVNG